MKNLCKIILLFFVLSVNAEAQSLTWQKWYDYNNMNSEGEDVIQTFDGGYLLLSNNFSASNYSTLLIKVNFNGNVEWQKLIDNTLIGFGVSCFSLSQADDSGYIVSGYGNNAILFKTDSRGNLKWIKNYSKPGFNTRFFDHKITKDEGIIAIGDIYPPDNRGYLVKTDSIGNLVWDSIYVNFSFINNKIINGIDSSYFISGLNRIFKIDLVGNIKWISLYNNVGESILQTKYGEIYTGSGNNDFYLSKLDTAGNVIWQRSYYPMANFRSLCLSKDNENLLLVGFKDTLSQYNIIAVKSDLNGNQIFSKRISSFIGNYFILPNSVKATNDSGYIFTGLTNFPGGITLDNTYGGKTDSLCNATLLIGIKNSISLIPKDFMLYQNFPNPFNSSTTISYELNKPELIELELYDLNGKKITNILKSFQSSGTYSITLNITELGLSSGVYYLRMSVSDNSNNFNNLNSKIIKLILLK